MKSINDIENQLRRIKDTYGYDNPRYEVARRLMCRYRWVIEHGRTYKDAKREYDFCLTKKGTIAVRYREFALERLDIMNNKKYPMEFYAAPTRVLYYVSCGGYHNTFSDKEQAIAKRNELLAVRSDREVTMFSFNEGEM